MYYVQDTKDLFDLILKRLNISEEDVEMMRYVQFLSGLVANYNFDYGFSNDKQEYCYTCPCSRTYTSWYKVLDIEETITVSTKSHVFNTSIQLIDHICSAATCAGSAFSGDYDLYHYLTLCYICAKHGEDKIGTRGREILTGIKKSGKKEKKGKEYRNDNS